MLEIFNPTAGPATGKVTMAPRNWTLDGQTLGVIWNGRPYGDRVINTVVDMLRQKYSFETVVFRKKPYIGNLAPLEIREEIIKSCDAVITGVGDWGSCTSGSVLDALTMERAGIPAAAIGVEKLVMTTGRGMARAQGIPDYPIAVVSHDMGAMADMHDDDDVQKMAAAAAPQVEAILLGKE